MRIKASKVFNAIALISILLLVYEPTNIPFLLPVTFLVTGFLLSIFEELELGGKDE